MTATQTLYNIADARDVLDTWLAETDGEVTPELEALLAELDATADEKIERVALYIREQKALASAATMERDRLGAIAKRRESAASSLTDYLVRQMDRLGKDKVSGVLVTIAFQKNPPRVTGDLSPEALSELFESSSGSLARCVPASFTLDKKAVLDAYKAGQALPSGLAVEQTVSLRIR